MTDPAPLLEGLKADLVAAAARQALDLAGRRYTAQVRPCAGETSSGGACPFQARYLAGDISALEVDLEGACGTHLGQVVKRQAATGRPVTVRLIIPTAP